jgi:hypothetical protein
MEYIGYLAMAIAIVGTFINARYPMSRLCFYLWIVSNGVFAVLSYLAGQWPQTGLFGYNLITCIIGLNARPKGEKVVAKKCHCGQAVHPQLGVYCKDCWWAQNPIEAADGDYIIEDGDVFLMPHGEMLS